LSNELSEWIIGFNELNPKTEEEEVKNTKEYKNNLFGVVIPALDRRDKKFYGKLNAEQQKDISIWILTRWMSSTTRDTPVQLCNVNDVANVGSKFLTKHKELQWILLSMTGQGRPTKHEWIAPPKGIKKNRLQEMLLNHFPLLRDDELDLLIKINSKENIEQFLIENGYDDKTIKEIFKGK
jgi:hypothetical protein